MKTCTNVLYGSCLKSELSFLIQVSQARKMRHFGDSHACNVGFTAVIALFDFALLNTL